MENEKMNSAEWNRLLDSVQIEGDPEIERLSEIIDRLGYNETPAENADLQDRLSLRLQKFYRIVAGQVADEMSKIDWVTRIVLFGSAGKPLKKDFRRYLTYSRRKTEIWHECRDIDLAVWVERQDSLLDLYRARGTAVKECSMIYPGISGLPHFLVEVHIMDTGTNQHLGELCLYKECPRYGVRECRAANGCGSTSLLRTLPEFFLRSKALDESQSMELFRKIP